MNHGLTIFGGAAVVLLGLSAALTWERPPVDTVQRGYRGTGMEYVANPRVVAKQAVLNQVPEAIPPVPNGGTLSKDAYENVQVLGDVDSEQFTRLMAAITEWVSPEQGCTYCHSDDGNFAWDGIYTKIVARRMIQMTRHLNADWQNHVKGTGVTCYTCHRGNPVPAQIWFKDVRPTGDQTTRINVSGQNVSAPAAAHASLPYDPFTPFLLDSQNIRVVTKDSPLRTNNTKSIKQTEWTYSLMMHMSSGLGVNCTYCHNTRSFMSWDQSNPARTSAWYGIRMVRDVNNAYLEPLLPNYPAIRLGPHGDAPKANCATCHHGIFKPLYGVSMLKDYPELAGPAPAKSAALQ